MQTALHAGRGALLLLSLHLSSASALPQVPQNAGLVPLAQQRSQAQGIPISISPLLKIVLRYAGPKNNCLHHF